MTKREKKKYMERSKARTSANPIGRLITRAKINARKRSVPFNITKADISPLPTHCAILGIKLTNNIGIDKRGSSYSLDRIIPSLGYIKGNICVISYRANVIKHDATVAELEAVLNYMKHRRK